MSGGSYNYAYTHAQDMADQLARRTETPLRRAFAAHLKLVAKAMRDIEWVDSGDGSDTEEASIRAVLGSAADADELSVLLEDAKAARDALALAIGKASLRKP